MIVANCDTSLIKNKVYTYENFNYEWFYRQPTIKKRKYHIVNTICTLDIETTKLDDIEQSICYIWQACINGVCIIGRELKDLKRFLDKLLQYTDAKTKIIFFVHNLSFEFHHLREILHFTDVFSVRRRTPLKAMYKQIEFRCSYLLTNRSLDAFLKEMKVADKKTSMDYNKKRYPWSKLNAKDTEYCLKDVIGLYEAIKRKLETEKDTLATIPLTSTGYTRRDVKKAMVKRSKKADFKASIATYEQFLELYEAFRGGNTHANRWISGKLLDSSDIGLIHSYDRVSSYPDVLLKHKYPWKFINYTGSIQDALKEGKAILTRVSFTNIELKDYTTGAPYIPFAKCRNVTGKILDNGRIIKASTLDITVTDIDLKIILDQYKFDIAQYSDTLISEYRELPKELKKVIIKYFKGKSKLKGVEDQEDEYMKFKNRFNSIYGLMVQSPAKLLIEYDEEYSELFHNENERTLKEVYEENKEKLFLLYQWGVWCTAWARWELQRAINHVESCGAIFLYCDTDSVKFIGNVDFTQYNKEMIDESIKVGAVAKDHKGNIHYIGVYEKESDMKQFITHGAKKYAYTDTVGILHLTCAGVNKKQGVKELVTIKWFKDGFIFGESAGLEAKYNDFPTVRKKIINGKSLHIYSNIYLKNSTYTLGKTKEYKSLLDQLPKYQYFKSCIA